MKVRLKSIRILLIGFALIIFVGGTLLWLPFSNHDGISFSDAIFTATSAACVTGLVVYDTYSQFTFFGQAVILVLIQVGGLGFMMIGVLFFLFMGRRIGLRQRALLMESTGIWKVGGIVRITRRVLIMTGIIELSGALLLAIRFCPQMGFAQGMWHALFHSVSAFCNAGFDLMGLLEPGSSLIHFQGDLLVNITISLLIIVGGLGFFLWNDLFEKKLAFTEYQLHTKIVLTTTGILLAIGTLGFFLLEKNTAMTGMSVSERLLASFFQSVTPRTAGFNTVEVARLSEGGTLLTMLLMLAIGIPIYVCSTSSIPIALGFMHMGVSPGAAFVFLISGPATNAAAISVVFKVLGRVSATIYILTVMIGSLAGGLIFDYLDQSFSIGLMSVSPPACHVELSLLETISAILMLMIPTYSFYRNRVTAGCASCHSDVAAPPDLVVNVDGMSCGNCANAVRNAIMEIDGIGDVQVRLSEKRAEIYGKCSAELVLQTVNDLGYTATLPSEKS